MMVVGETIIIIIVLPPLLIFLVLRPQLFEQDGSLPRSVARGPPPQ
jgi:hypothetical protein